MTQIKNIWAKGQNNPETMDSTIFFTRLSETITWCYRFDNDATKFRSDQIKPNLIHNGIDEVICAVGQSRSSFLNKNFSKWNGIQPDLLGGKLFVYFPDADLSDGMAEYETNGFLDVYNCPPYDTWIAFFDDQKEVNQGYSRYLVCYIPYFMAEKVQSGIELNAEDCISWLEDADVKFSDRYRKLDKNIA